MAKFGKGKPMPEQAQALLRQHLELSSRHAAKALGQVAGSRSTGKIHSMRTFEKYASALAAAGQWAREREGLRHLANLSKEQAQAYLARRAILGIGQKQLDADRNAMEFVLGKGSLNRVQAEEPLVWERRAYTPEQVRAVIRQQSEENALASRIAYEAGLRGHELLTLRRREEAEPSRHRHWRAERFVGREEGVRYVVTGKGGLVREVRLSKDTAARLEERRLAAPRSVLDRGIRYQQAYDLNGGNRWSSSWRGASLRTLGWSTGAHGLRHSYAQERMAELAGKGFAYETAREIVSQELGHFRGEILEVYLR